METQSIEKTRFAGDRVREHTAPAVTERIDRMTEAELDAAVAAGPSAILRRLVKLESEWDVDRALMVNFALAGAASLTTGLVRYQRTPGVFSAAKGLPLLVRDAARVSAPTRHGRLVPTASGVSKTRLPNATRNRGRTEPAAGRAFVDQARLASARSILAKCRACDELATRGSPWHLDGRLRAAQSRFVNLARAASQPVRGCDYVLSVFQRL